MYDPQKYDLAIDEIPTWMRPRYRGIDWALLATLLLCFVLSAPLITRRGLPPTLEAELQMYRVIEIAESLEEGVLYPRWAPDFNYGYGSPLFNYIAPLPHYLGGFYMSLTQETPHTAVRVMLIVPIFILGISVMAFVRRRWGELAGVVAACIVLCAPHTSIISTYLTTDPGALWALALFTTSLWALDRAFILGRGRDLIILAFSGGALVVADTALSPVLFAFVAAWGLVVAITHASTCHWRVPLVGVLLGMPLSAFYMLPALTEHDEVRWQAFTTYANDLDTSRLFDAIPQFDRTAFNPPPIPYLGVATWLLASIGALWLLVEIGLSIRGKPNQSYQELIAALLFIPAALVLVIAMRSPNSTLWNAADSFEALQPADLLGPLTVCCAILAAQVVPMIELYLRHIARRLLGIGIVTFIIGASAANALYVPHFAPVQDPVTLNRNLNHEVRGHALATLLNGHLLPARVQQLPLPSRSISDIKRAEKIERQSLLPNSPVTIVAHGPIHDEFIIESSQAQEITILTFNYAGWQAERNNSPIALNNQANGLMTVRLNPGNNTIDLRFRNTPVRHLGWLITGGALLLVCLTGYLLERQMPEQPIPLLNPLELKLKRERQVLSGTLVLVLATLCVIVRMEPDLVTQQTPPRAIPPGITPMDRIIENGLSFLGYRLDDVMFSPGHTLFLNTYWQANYPNLDDFQIRILLTESDEVVAHQSYRHIASWPSRLWPLQGYVLGTYAIRVPDRPGIYQIRLELGACERPDLRPCETIIRQSISDFQGTIERQIVLPQAIEVR
jgi:4-amino-4-deoxy-L-arabinose transferase-like glycosyltransferase